MSIEMEERWDLWFSSTYATIPEVKPMRFGRFRTEAAATAEAVRHVRRVLDRHRLELEQQERSIQSASIVIGNLRRVPGVEACLSDPKLDVLLDEPTYGHLP